jgi:hypothetical protein
MSRGRRRSPNFAIQANARPRCGHAGRRLRGLSGGISTDASGQKRQNSCRSMTALGFHLQQLIQFLTTA